MKKYFVLFVALIAAFMITACTEKEPQDLLAGVWEVSVKMTLKGGVGEQTAERTIDGGIWYYTFYKEGNGKRVKVDDVEDSAKFTYIYHQEDDTIDYVMNGTPFVWEVDVLTNDTFFFHSSSASSATILGVPVTSSSQSTYSGKKIK